MERCEGNRNDIGSLRRATIELAGLDDAADLTNKSRFNFL